MTNANIRAALLQAKEELDAQIAGLEREIVHRDESASTIDERNAPPQGVL